MVMKKHIKMTLVFIFILPNIILLSCGIIFLLKSLYTSGIESIIYIILAVLTAITSFFKRQFTKYMKNNLKIIEKHEETP
jgi:hypothetical protein